MLQITPGFIFLLLFLTVSCQKQESYQARVEEIFPPVLVQNVALNRMGNLPVSVEFFKGQWTLVVFGSGNCKSACQHRLELVNEAANVKKLLVIDGLATPAKLRELAGSYPDVAVTMGITASTFDHFYAQFDVESIAPEQKRQHIYLVSPSAELVYSLSSENLTADDLAKEISLLKK